ncbi:hypothetical protein PINS_up010374 [Pythium insidiosum]|nr:hypothetical protein PINS_up010374 [Pythium insidiosum]
MSATNGRSIGFERPVSSIASSTFSVTVACTAASTSSSSLCSSATQTIDRGSGLTPENALLFDYLSSWHTSQGFGALVLRFQEPRASMLIYKSGKFVVVGAKTPTDAHTTVDKFVSVLQKIDFPHDLASFTIANVICSIDLRFRLRLEGLAHDHRRFCTYEPELFPGLIYRYLRSNVTLLVFVSGKVVITGSKSIEQAEDVLVKMYPVLLQYRWREELSSSDSESDADSNADADVELGDSDDSDAGILL